MMIERRRFVRVDQPVRVRYRLGDKEQVEGEAFSRNISGMGVCLPLNESVAVGSLLKLTLVVPGTLQPVGSVAEVAWLSKTEGRDGNIEAGVEAGLKFTSISNVGKAIITNFVYESVKRRKSTEPSPVSPKDPS